MDDAVPDFDALLRVLAEAGVDFIIVGGVCGVLHGAPISTFDLDLVHSREADNITLLDGALALLNARYRDQPELRPEPRFLAGPGHHLLLTRFGPLDLLGVTVDGQGYGELIPHTVSVDLEQGSIVRILDLPTLIRIKESLGRERDRAVLPILRRTLEEQARNEGQGSGSKPP